MANSPVGRSVTFRGEEHWVTREDILSVTTKEVPRRINAYYVEVDGKRYPPKQLVRATTGTSQFFDTAAAVSLLRALGFTVLKTSP